MLSELLLSAMMVSPNIEDNLIASANPQSKSQITKTVKQTELQNLCRDLVIIERESRILAVGLVNCRQYAVETNCYYS